MFDFVEIPGFGGRYLITRSGEVVSTVYGKKKYLRQSKNSGGYLSLSLSHLDGREVKAVVHRLVAEAFIENAKNLPQVNHINGIKTDNRVENLEWVTASENMKHASEMGLRERAKFKGEKHPNRILTTEEVLSIRIKYKPKEVTMKKLSNEFGVSIPTINDILKRRSWKEI